MIKMFISQGDGLFSIALHLVELLVACFVFFVTVGAIYRLLFHPLTKYPGPFLAKLTDVHLAYHAWKGDRHLHFYRCHEKYGEIPWFFGGSRAAIGKSDQIQY